MKLPLFVTPRNRIVIGVAMFGICYSLYLAANHSPIFPPQLLPMTWVDQTVPFLPWTVWIYGSEWIYFAFVFLGLQDSRRLNQGIYAFLTLNLISIAIFFFWPTTFPRHLYPLPEIDDGSWISAATIALFRFVREMDAPTNCAPSLHVSSVYLWALMYLNEDEGGRGKFITYLAWATLIALSTLTTKQHYLVDLVSGLWLAVICWWYFFRVAEYRELAPTTLNWSVRAHGQDGAASRE